VVIAGATGVTGDCADGELSLPQPLSVKPSNSNVRNVPGVPAWRDVIDAFSGFTALFPPWEK